MVCPKCNNQIDDNKKFCSNCGYNLSNEIINNIDGKGDLVQNNNVRRMKSKVFVIIFGIIIFGLIFGFILLFTNKGDKTKSNSLKNEKKYNTLEKINTDYQKGNLSVNDYFTQLVYYEFLSDKVDSKYSSDYKYYSTEEELGINDLLDNHYDELDKNIVNFYLSNKFMTNVSFKADSNSLSYSLDYDENVKLVADEYDLSKVSNHFLNKVYLSSNKNFLIWYADIGDDAITEEELQMIANGLEKSVKLYEKEFNINFSYSPYVDNKAMSIDWEVAKILLEKNNISESTIDTAMSVYIYDTGSDSILASYSNLPELGKAINRIANLFTSDGVMNYPYIIINKRGITGGIESLEQLYNHELFHHFQHLFCYQDGQDRCSGDFNITEGMANFASSIAGNSKNSDNYLNNWASIYTPKTSLKLFNIANNNGVTGYPLFNYFYSYYKNVDDWAKILMDAHTSQEPFRYIQDNTSKQDLIDTINDLAYRTISQSYDNKALLSYSGINVREYLKDKEKYDLTIYAGAIDYFGLNPKTSLTVSTNNNDDLTIKVYGYKDGKYYELKSSNDKLEIDKSLYGRYDKYYLAVTNANLVRSYEYTISVGDNSYVKNSMYDTTFKNYNIEISMKTKINGIEVSQYAIGIVDELHQKEYLDFDVTSMGFTVSSKIYYDFNSGYTYMTQPYGGDVWIKQKGTTQMVDLKKILSKLNKMKNVTKIKDNHFKIKMTKDDISDLMSSASASTSMIKGDVSVDVYTEGGHIIKLEYDFSNMISSIQYFTVTIEFSDYDVAGDVDIPQSVVDSAISM